MKNKIFKSIKHNKKNIPIGLLNIHYDSNYDEHLKDNTYQKKSELHQTDKFVVRYPFLKIF